MKICTPFAGRLALDVAVCAAILIGAGIYFHSVWLGMSPYAWNSGDIQQVLGFLAADRNPGQFDGDLVLDNPANYRTYWSLHNPVIDFLTEWVADSGTAVLLILPLQISLYGCAWYLFGRIVFRSPLWGIVLVILNFATVRIGLGTWWGIASTPIPRQTFQALLPFMLLAAWRFRRKPSAKPWLMVAAGLLLYVHAVSGPTVGFAIFAGLCWFWPPQYSWTKRIGWMALAAVLFLVVIAPFAFHYLSTYEHGVSNLDLSAVREAMRFRYAPGFLDPWSAITDFLWIWVSTGILPAACVSVLWLWWKGAERETLAVFLSWLGGGLVVSILVPLIDHGLAAVRDAMPVQIDVIRTLRYALPFSFLIIVLGLYVSSRDAARPLFRFAVPLLAVVLATAYLRVHPTYNLKNALLYVAGSYPTDEFKDRRRDWLDLLDAIRGKTSPTARIAAPRAKRSQDHYLSVRYIAHRPLLYTFKDGGILGYTNHDRLLKWHDRALALQRIRAIDNPAARLDALAVLARSWEATHVILEDGDRSASSVLPAGMTVVYENDNFQLLAVDPEGVQDERTE